MKTCARYPTGLIVLIVAIGFAMNLLGGGSGLNIVVVVNQNSTNSVQLGNYYCEKRNVPPQNVLRINWTGGNINWTKSEFESLLRTPLNSMLSSRQLTNQIDYVLLSMDIPYRVRESGLPLTSGTNSTTSALYYGFKPDGCIICSACNLAGGSASAYAGSEDIFRQTPPISTSSNSWLVMMLTSSNLAQAKAVVDRGVASDGTFPAETVYLIHHDFDPFRGVRYVLYDDSIFDNRARGLESVVRTNTYSPSVAGFQLGSQFGLVSATLVNFYSPGSLFAPGAMADNLTSYGGFIFDSQGHMGPLDYLNAGATASYGTVIEPCNFLEKFASPRNYFYQSRGFTVAECYYQSVTNPYQGLLLGEPLAAPFALPAGGNWIGLPANAVLSGATNLSVQFTAPDTSRPVQRVDLFMDGTFLLTVTNNPPRANNILYVSINGFTTNFTVPANATLKSVASNLTARLNQNSYSNATKVAASAHGDRIELRSVAPLVSGGLIPVTVSNYIGSAAALTTSLSASRPDFLDTVAQGLRYFFVTNVATVNNFLLLTVTKTNGAVVQVGVTNTTGMNTGELVKSLASAINSSVSLMEPDGVVAEDVFDNDFYINQHAGEFNLLARAPGWREAQVQADLDGSPNFTLKPSANTNLEENISDLRPRNHLYITAGFTNLPLTLGFNTTTQADGFHELTAVAYEGSHVRTQRRIPQSVLIQNTTLSATFTSLVGDTNTALESTLGFSVVANTNNITKIELFSTGDTLAVSNGVSSTTFSIAATNLGIGLHPFYAVVTRADSKQYRTETKWIRIIGAESPFALAVVDPTPTLAWPATAGRRYEVLSTISITDTFLLRDAVTPTNSQGQWSETNNSAPQRFYRVRTAQ